MAQTCETTINLEHDVLTNIGQHFNSPDTSDVTLTVGEASYQVHRFILSVQSSVFSTMLMNGHWKESDKKVIRLEESLECELVFEQFLKFLYTGILTLSYSDVCAIHVLADKYDVAMLKKRAVPIMEEVLSDRLGEACPSAALWLPHIEHCVPSLIPICYESIRTNFIGYTMPKINVDIVTLLESRHLKEILTRKSNNVVALSEFSVFEFVTKWATLKFNDLTGQKTKEELRAILKLIRFNNMNGDQLMAVEESELCKAIGNSFITDHILPGYRVHSQMASIVRNSCSTRPWDSADHCPHLNPQFYFENPYGVQGYFIKPRSNHVTVQPLDVRDLKLYAQLRTVGMTLGGHFQVEGEWRIQWKSNYGSTEAHINEVFTITPAWSNIGRQFTIIISVSGTEKMGYHRYTIKRTGTVAGDENDFYEQAEEFLYHSPNRSKGSWKIHETDNGPFWIGIAIHLHK